jgi:hypothetical protein
MSPLAFRGTCVNGGRECPKGWADGAVSDEGGLRTLGTDGQRRDRDSAQRQIPRGHPYPTPNSTHPSWSWSAIKRNRQLPSPTSTAHPPPAAYFVLVLEIATPP